MNAAILAVLLESERLPASTELRLQDAIEALLKDSGVTYEREVHLSASDRPDFMVGAVAIEVKIHGGLSDVSRQLLRYTQHERVCEVLLVTSRTQLARVPRMLSGKPIFVSLQMGGL